jgi:cell division septal protein FtsQ
VGAQAEQELREHERHVEPNADGERAVEARRRVVVAVAVRVIVVIVLAVIVIVMIVRVRHLVAGLVSGAAAHW